ncbi:transcriptional regulator, LacI family [Gracilibacillus orientalis]|uniref:Transcriptional regulator, LacI family n=1 Tax=Gracilibacillus orientalis TaxID=334253 RepID=A0A1I4GUA3_9BACI|nr:LacI family DNA-binding transcriptional regulator [Gracilibacillus orientalis]SFL33509.1 transcriptional regulator, LacI family [Gracilibacillus orientalis]
MKVTIYDVAEKAGVSIATVSKVINSTGNMRQATRERVLSVMEELNYYPSMMASALTGKKTETLGLLVPDISNPFFSEIARTIEDRAHEKGLSVIMCSTDESLEKEKKYLELLRRKQVDGFIIASSFNDKNLLKGIKSASIPLVMLTQEAGMAGVTSVAVDDFSGGYDAANHLLELGHQKIALINENRLSSKMRVYGFREAYESHGYTFTDDMVITTNASLANGKKVLQTIINNGNLPSAIFACNDLLAIGVLQGARERGINIPEDLSLMGFDNTILATTSVPGLTTIAQPIEEMGKKVVDVIIDSINNKYSGSERILYNPELMQRDTTRVLSEERV